MVRARWGRIVNVSSVVGLVGNAGQANYAASKAGIIGFTKSVAREVAQRGITANAVAPGYVETELTGGLPEDVKEQILGAGSGGKVRGARGDSGGRGVPGGRGCGVRDRADDRGGRRDGYAVSGFALTLRAISRAGAPVRRCFEIIRVGRRVLEREEILEKIRR